MELFIFSSSVGIIALSTAKCRSYDAYLSKKSRSLISYLQMELGQRLKEIRTFRNYTQKELSEQSGLTLRTIQRIENNEVKPSLHSLKAIGAVLKTDLSEFDHKSDTKPYEFTIYVKMTDMNQLMNDLKALVKNNWKILLWIILIVFFISNYTDIKSGLMDGWNAK